MPQLNQYRRRLSLRWFQLMKYYYERQARIGVSFLEKRASTLPSPDQEFATRKRIRYCKTRIREGTSWRISRQIVEARLFADERMQLMTECERHARRASMSSSTELSPKLAGELTRAFGETVCTFSKAEASFSACRKTWLELVSEARQVSNPLFAFHVFFRLSEHSRLEIASLIVAGLIASGAVRMLFFYATAAEQSVYAYWVWDDLVIQAINVIPLVLGGLLLSEALFRVAWLACEKGGHPGLILFILRHPTSFALLFLISLMLSASFLGHHQGVAVWDDFRESGGTQSATMLDRTYLAGVHLVGTTSRTAVFLRENATFSEPVRPEPRYLESLKDVACALPFPRSWCEDDAEDNVDDGGYLVYVMDRDKILCHAKAGQCESIPLVPSGSGPTSE